jgi:DNA (cytosine-5)-methyltransferase 1
MRAGEARHFDSVTAFERVTGGYRLQPTHTVTTTRQRFDLNGMALSAADSDCARDGGRSLFGISLCAGAGGLDLGLHIAAPGYRTVGYVERESYAAATLVARMEDAALDQAPVWDDVTSFDGKPWRGIVDIVHGGYPCQPFSVAGKKLGHNDPRHLWPHIARIVAECQPRLCFFENVGGHLRLGFEQVHDDLRSMGYGVKAGLFTAEEIGAPHKRERLFILAYRESVVRERSMPERNSCGQSEGTIGSQCANMANTPRAGNYRETANISEADERQIGSLLRIADGSNHVVVDTYRARLERRNAQGHDSTDEQSPFPPGPSDRSGWQRYLERWSHLEPSVCGGADGLANRVDRLRLCGNGVVPLVAAYAFQILTTASNIEL